MIQTIEDTIAFIREAHAGQMDWSGEEYWTHPVAVMKLLPEDATEDEKHAALLHDVVEDTDHTIETLRARGYSEDTLVMVDFVTRDKNDGRSYMDWIRSIVASGNRGAMRVKLADNRHNSDPARIARITDPEKRAQLEQMAAGRYARSMRVLVAGLAVLDTAEPA